MVFHISRVREIPRKRPQALFKKGITKTPIDHNRVSSLNFPYNPPIFRLCRELLGPFLHLYSGFVEDDNATGQAEKMIPSFVANGIFVKSIWAASDMNMAPPTEDPSLTEA